MLTNDTNFVTLNNDTNFVTLNNDTNFVTLNNDVAPLSVVVNQTSVDVRL